MRLRPGRDEVIDVVGVSPDGEEVVAVLIQTEPWEGSPRRWNKLQRRLNAAAALILEEHAEAHDKRIELYVPNEATWGAEALEAAQSAVAKHGIELRVKVGLPG